MAIEIKAYANADDALVAWRPEKWSDAWIGFQLERRDDTSGEIEILANRIPPRANEGPVAPGGISSAKSPFRRCLWTDHGVSAAETVSYRVTPMTEAAGGAFVADAAARSGWTKPTVVTADAGEGMSAWFNRGTLMSQVVSRFVHEDVSRDSLAGLLKRLAVPGAPERDFLSGDIRKAILRFLRQAERNGSAIYLAIYEINDRELVDALKPFGARGHVLIGNGGATKDWVGQELAAAGLEVRHRDLSRKGRSSPSVHNKFLVETDASGEHAVRVLTGSTNWTVTGLCTQLNNVVVIDQAAIAARFRNQWDKLVAAGNSMTQALKDANSIPTIAGGVSAYFSASNHEEEFTPVLELIRSAKEGVLFLMFMPGQSPLLRAALDRVVGGDVYVRGVVSSIRNSKHGDIRRLGGQVVRSGSKPRSFHYDVTLPSGVGATDAPSWEEPEFAASELLAARLFAIVHSKVMVIDPFSENCAVVTGSHNFSVSASKRNDENLVVLRGNQALARAYGLHINTVYDHYSWRAFLHRNGGASTIYKSMMGWRPGGSRAQELDFWMGAPLVTAPQAPTSSGQG